MGDSLFAIGYDATKPDIGIRLWVGSVYSVYKETSLNYTFIRNDGTNMLMQPETILTGGDSVFGMSGAPVFNGCGISGISVGIDLRTYDNLYTLFSGARVVHITHLLELLMSAKASDYSVKLSESNTICDIPVKSYC